MENIANKEVQIKSQQIKGVVIAQTYIDPDDPKFLITHRPTQTFRLEKNPNPEYWGTNGKVQVLCEDGFSRVFSFDDVKVI